MIDMDRALKVATETGSVRFGLKEVRRAAAEGSARLIVTASNCPADLTKAGPRVVPFSGSSVELGNACGKPFSVSALAVLDPGDSNILSA